MRTQRRKRKFRKNKLLRKTSKFTNSRKIKARRKRKNPFDEGYDLGYGLGYHNRHIDDLLTRPRGPETNFDIGYDEGFNIGYNQSYDEAYEKGMYKGGEGIVDDLLPHDIIAPEVSLKQIIMLGLEQVREYYCPLIPSHEVANLINEAFAHKRPLSIVRIGDGELLTLAHELVMSSEEVKRKGVFLHYAGVDIPDVAFRDQLAYSIKKADIIGIPKLRLPNYLPLMVPAFQANGINYKQLRLTHSSINYLLNVEGLLQGVLSGKRIVVIGNEAMGLTSLLQSVGMIVMTPIVGVHGVKDIPRVMGEVAKQDFDIALVSAGIAAVVICERIASELGKIALDFGHLADSLIKGDMRWNS